MVLILNYVKHNCSHCSILLLLPQLQNHLNIPIQSEGVNSETVLKSGLINYFMQKLKGQNGFYNSKEVMNIDGEEKF